jgi:hypothetical protein
VGRFTRMAKRRTLRSILLNSASRKSFRFVSRNELTRVGLSPNTKLLVPKTLKRVTKKTAAIKPSELSKVAKTRGTKRDKALERAASKIVSLDKSASQQTVRRQKRRDTEFSNAERTTATSKRAVRQERNQEFTARFLDKVRVDIARGTLIKKAGGKNNGKLSPRPRSDSAATALENRRKRLAGEHIPDGEYQAMLDYMAHYNDPYYELLRGSPDVKGSRIK